MVLYRTTVFTKEPLKNHFFFKSECKKGLIYFYLAALLLTKNSSVSQQILNNRFLVPVNVHNL